MIKKYCEKGSLLKKIIDMNLNLLETNTENQNAIIYPFKKMIQK